MLADDTALTLFPVTAAVDIPCPCVGKGAPCLVADGEVADLTAVQVAYHNIALCPFRVDAHLASLRDAGITVSAQHHLDVEVFQQRTGR